MDEPIRSRPTILVDRYRQAASTAAGRNSYRGLRIHALPGLHEFVVARCVEHFDPQARLLDLGAGSGALALRLEDHGFRVAAVDYVRENFRPDSMEFVAADLNGDFAARFDRVFGALVASEIVEHLENPRHFARQCFSLLEPGGRMLLSTPNIANAGSRAAFVRSGEFLWFSEADYAGQGHITPLGPVQIERAFREAGFGCVWRGSFGRGASRIGGSPRLRLLAWLIERLLSATPPELDGEIFVAVFERPRTPAQAGTAAPGRATGSVAVTDSSSSTSMRVRSRLDDASTA